MYFSKKKWLGKFGVWFLPWRCQKRAGEIPGFLNSQNFWMIGIWCHKPISSANKWPKPEFLGLLPEVSVHNGLCSLKTRSWDHSWICRLECYGLPGRFFRTSLASFGLHQHKVQKAAQRPPNFRWNIGTYRWVPPSVRIAPPEFWAKGAIFWPQLCRRRYYNPPKNETNLVHAGPWCLIWGGSHLEGIKIFFRPSGQNVWIKNILGAYMPDPTVSHLEGGGLWDLPPPSQAPETFKSSMLTCTRTSQAIPLTCLLCLFLVVEAKGVLLILAVARLWFDPIWPQTSDFFVHWKFFVLPQNQPFYLPKVWKLSVGTFSALSQVTLRYF